MATEIERKFLVDKEQWLGLEKPVGETYRQGYLLAEDGKTIRVRQTPEKGFLTIKGSTVGITRLEYEYEIPLVDAVELLDKFSQSELTKTRYKIVVEDKIWEVDEFKGLNNGLIIAEIELNTENEAFATPTWVMEEVTGQKKYYNSQLTKHPFSNW